MVGGDCGINERRCDSESLKRFLDVAIMQDDSVAVALENHVAEHHVGRIPVARDNHLALIEQAVNHPVSPTALDLVARADMIGMVVVIRITPRD